MANLIAKKYKKVTGTGIAGYQVALQKLATENSGFTNGDKIIIEYKKNKITLTKNGKENYNER